MNPLPFSNWPERLRAAQGNFARTGGIHAAAIFDLEGNLLVLREDVGRHNAVDKAIGRAFLDELLPLDNHIMLVSGRSSLEIVQKALAAGIPIIAGGFGAFFPGGELRPREQSNANRLSPSADLQHLLARRARHDGQIGHQVYQRWKAGWPSVTATKVPRQVAQAFPPAVNVPSTVARLLVDSTTLAERKTSPSVGVGRSNLIA